MATMILSLVFLHFVCIPFRSAYFFFCADPDERSTVMTDYPNYKPTEVTRELAERWTACTDRKKYEDQAADDKKRYEDVSLSLP